LDPILRTVLERGSADIEQTLAGKEPAAPDDLSLAQSEAVLVPLLLGTARVLPIAQKEKALKALADDRLTYRRDEFLELFSQLTNGLTKAEIQKSIAVLATNLGS